MDYINGNNLLTIGIQYHPVRGGVAAVISSYSKMIKPFHFIGTVNDSNKLFKLIVFIKALFVFMYYMLVKHNIKIVHIHGASYVRERVSLSYSARLLERKLFIISTGEDLKNSAKNIPMPSDIFYQKQIALSHFPRIGKSFLKKSFHVKR